MFNESNCDYLKASLVTEGLSTNHINWEGRTEGEGEKEDLLSAN